MKKQKKSCKCHMVFGTSDKCLGLHKERYSMKTREDAVVYTRDKAVIRKLDSLV